MRVLAVIIALMFVGAATQQSVAPVSPSDCLPKVFGLVGVFQNFNLQNFLADQRYNKQVVAAVLETLKTCAAFLPVPQLAQSVSCKSVFSNAMSLLKAMLWDLTSRNWTKLATDRASFMTTISSARSACSK